MIWLLNKLRLIQGVWLRASDGQIYQSWIRRTDPFSGKPFCHVYPYTRVGGCILNPDGTTGGSSCYIKQWKPMP